MDSGIVTVENEKLVPELRFPEFESEWNLVKLKELTRLITKGTTPPKFSSKGVNYVKIESLDGLEILQSRCLKINTNTHENYLKRSILEENDILFAIAGATVGKVGYVKKEILPANTNQALAIIRLKKFNQKDFLMLILASRVMKRYIYQSQSVGAQPNLNLKQVGDFEFYTPQIKEQQKIARFLTAIDQRITLLKQKKAALEQYKKGMMQKIFNQELRFKQDYGNDYPDWEEKGFAGIFQAISAKKHQIYSKEIEPTGLFKVVDQGKELVAGYSNKKEMVFSNKPVIIYGDHTTSIKYVDFQFIIGADGTKILSNKEGNLKYLYYYLDFNNIEPEGYKRHFSILKQLKIMMPSMKEQQKIADCLSAIDQSINQVSKQIDQTSQFKKGLLQRMFV